MANDKKANENYDFSDLEDILGMEDTPLEGKRGIQEADATLEALLEDKKKMQNEMADVLNRLAIRINVLDEKINALYCEKENLRVEVQTRKARFRKETAQPSELKRLQERNAQIDYMIEETEKELISLKKEYQILEKGMRESN